MSAPFAEVIGDPIAHSKSPAIHGFWLEKLGIAGDYRAAQVRADALAGYFARRRQDPAWRGCNVTVPHKQAVIPLLDSLSAIASEAGAVNLIAPVDGRLVGDNSDVLGIIDALPADLWPERPLDICLIGSGGAARAALAAFRRMTVGRLSLLVRDLAKGEKLLAGFGFENRCLPLEAAADIGAADLVVNATTLGMAGQQPMPPAVLHWVAAAPSRTVVFDMVYAPLDTELLRTARAAGNRTVDGLTMLIGQAGAAFERFFGAPAPRGHDAALRALLTS